MIRSREEAPSGTVQRTEHLYDSASRLTAQNWTIGESGFSESYEYRSSDGLLDKFSITSMLPNGTGFTKRLICEYDGLKRLQQVAIRENNSTSNLYTRNYSYLDHASDSTRTTSRLGTYTFKNASGEVLSGSRYVYDANGNITKIYEVFTVNSTDTERLIAEYGYDALNQLKTETRYTYTGNSTTPTTTTVVTYTIDTAGNIRSVSDGQHTISYTYGDAAWADLLTGINLDGISYSINYASPGNPSNWFNETVYTDLTWTQGRRLSSVTKGTDTYQYEYDMSGIRTVKIADGKRHEYVTQNGRVVRETVYAWNSTTEDYSDFQYALDFTYDESGHPFTMRKYLNEGMTSNYITMQYVCNAQGDVVKLVYNGAVFAEYTYDAWGKVLEAKENGSYDYAAVNPLRYRGYYYDTETEFYYLQSRYYDPAVKRFLNADAYASTGQGYLGYNMFSYCGNNPVINIDGLGTSFVSFLKYMYYEVVNAIRIADMYVRYGKPTKAFTKNGVHYEDYVNRNNDFFEPDNCYSFSEKEDSADEPGKESGRQYNNMFDVEDVFLSVKYDQIAKGRYVRRLSSATDLLFPGEYRVAFRVGTDYYTINGKLYWDCHFMVQTDDGRWAEKRGRNGDYHCYEFGVLPCQVSWDCGSAVGYYDSPIVYYAIGGN